MSGSTDAARQALAGGRAWMLVGSVLAASLISTQAITTNAASETNGNGRLVRIYADAGWYKSRPEPERRWRGILRRRPVVEGPGSRTALTFALDTAESTYPVYAAGVERELAPFTGRWVEVEGKLVDLGDEGFGKELWIATARSIGEPPRYAPAMLTSHPHPSLPPCRGKGHSVGHVHAAHRVFAPSRRSPFKPLPST